MTREVLDGFHAVVHSGMHAVAGFEVGELPGGASARPLAMASKLSYASPVLPARPARHFPRPTLRRRIKLGTFAPLDQLDRAALRHDRDGPR